MKSVQLDSIVTMIGGGTPSKARPEYYANGTIPWVTPKDMKSWEITNAIERITQNALDESATRLIPTDSVLLVVRSGILKHSLPIAINRVPVALNQDMKALVCDSTVLPEYLARFLQWSAPRILSQARATTADNLPVDGLRKLRLSLPPLPEQLRIAALLDKADAIRRKRQQAIRLADDLLRSAFLDMFGDPVTNPKGWPAGSIDLVVGDPAEDVRCGPFGTQLKVAELQPSGVPLLGIDNVLAGRMITPKTRYLSSDKASDLRRFDARGGDVLITRMGTIGRAWVVPGGAHDARISYHLFRVRPTPDKCLPEFLAATVEHSGTFHTQLRRMAHGAIMDGLSTSDLRAVRFLVPPVGLQQRYLSLLSAVATARLRQRTQLEETERLLDSLTSRSFGATLPA